MSTIYYSRIKDGGGFMPVVRAIATQQHGFIVYSGFFNHYCGRLYLEICVFT